MSKHKYTIHSGISESNLFPTKYAYKSRPKAQKALIEDGFYTGPWTKYRIKDAPAHEIVSVIVKEVL